MNITKNTMTVTAVTIARIISIISVAPSKNVPAVGTPNNEAQIPKNRRVNLFRKRLMYAGRVVDSIA